MFIRGLFFTAALCDFAITAFKHISIIQRFKRHNIMAWGIVLLCIVLGSLVALRPSGRTADFRREKPEGK